MHRYYRHVHGIGNEITYANATIQKLSALLVVLCGGGCAFKMSKQVRSDFVHLLCVGQPYEL